MPPKEFRPKRLLPLLLITAFILLTGCAESKDKTTVLRLAHGLATDHVVHRAMVYMDKRLQAISKGAMRVDIYPNGQLGSERELIELLQIGSLAMTKVSASPMESFVPAFKIFSIPYVFRDHQHFWRVLESELGQQLLRAAEPVRLRGLGYYDAGSRSFYSNDKAITQPDDLRGLKIRVQKSVTSIDMVNTLGGSATPISWGELYTALQQGVVDGAENNPPSFFLSKHYEVSRFYSLDEHTFVPDLLLIGLPAWRQLSGQQQQWLQQAADESIVYQRQLWQHDTQKSLVALSEAGVTIVYPDKQAFRERVKPMHEKFQNTAIGDLLDAINRLP